jgi:hypothetical protein
VGRRRDANQQHADQVDQVSHSAQPSEIDLLLTPSLGIFLAGASTCRPHVAFRECECSVSSSVRKCTEEPWTHQSPVGSFIELLVG